MAPTQLYSRRNFLKQATRATSGLLLLSSAPSLLKSRQLIGNLAYVERAFYTMGTTVTISAYGEDRSHLNEAITKAFEEIQSIDNVMSLYKPASQITTINRLAGKEPVNVDQRVLDIVQHARHFNGTTSGTFDITIEPLMELWGFRNEPIAAQTIPSDAEIYKRLDAVGMKNIEVNEQQRTVGLLNVHSKIDLGGIAVGYSVDRAVEVLRRQGIEQALINHSGDVYALGAPPESEGWEIAIPNPIDRREIISTFTLRDKAVSTSGNYEKFVEINGHKFGHILDPHSGKPGDAMLSLTIVAEQAMTADAFSTGLFCSDQQCAAAIMKRIKETEMRCVVQTDRGIERRHLRGV